MVLKNQIVRVLSIALALSFSMLSMALADSAPSLLALPRGATTQIYAPDSSLPQEVRSFSGEWSEEKWISPTNKTVRTAKLYVLKVQADGAEVLYGCGDSLLTASKAFWFQGNASFRKEGDRLVMILSVNNNIHRFWIEDGKLVGRNPFMAEINMRKIR
jgi:hypothetical protein